MHVLQLLEESYNCSECGLNFAVIEEIPVFLVASIKNSIVTDYIEHYQQDGKVFDYYLETDKQTIHDNKRMHQLIIKNIPGYSKVILDVGAGSNWVAKCCLPKGKEVFAVDISLENIKVAKARYGSPLYHGFVADAFSLPFKEGSFDCIIASEIIEHTVDPELFVKQLFSKLKKGGRLIVSTPYKEKIPMHLCIHCNKPTPSNAHLHSFDKPKLKNLLKDESLKKVSFITYSNKMLAYMRSYVLFSILPFWLWRIFDWFMNKLMPKPAKIVAIYEK